jgi:hypothetical protein
MIFLLASDVYRITKNALQKYEYCKLGVFWILVTYTDSCV